MALDALLFSFHGIEVRVATKMNGRPGSFLYHVPVKLVVPTLGEGSSTAMAVIESGMRYDTGKGIFIDQLFSDAGVDTGQPVEEIERFMLQVSRVYATLIDQELVEVPSFKRMP